MNLLSETTYHRTRLRLVAPPSVVLSADLFVLCNVCGVQGGGLHQGGHHERGPVLSQGHGSWWPGCVFRGWVTGEVSALSATHFVFLPLSSGAPPVGSIPLNGLNFLLRIECLPFKVARGLLCSGCTPPRKAPLRVKFLPDFACGGLCPWECGVVVKPWLP